MIPDDFDDNELLNPIEIDDDDLDGDEFDEWDEFEFDDDLTLCPRCEDRDMKIGSRYCHACEREIWLHENG